MNNWQIKDLKGVGDVELNLDSNQRVFTFLGNNGIGKTRLIEALALCTLVQTNVSLDNLIIKSDKNFFDKIAITGVKFYITDTEYDEWLDLRQLSGNMDISYIAWSYIGANKRSVIADTRTHHMSYSGSILKKIQFAIDHNEFSEFGMSENLNAWFVEKARFINPYQIEKDNSQIAIESVLQCLHKIDNAFDDKFLQINENDNVYLKVNGEVLELSELSSGFLSLVKIIQSIIASFSAFTNEKDLLNVKGVVLIDEIESHLHLEWQVKIIPILKNLFPYTTFYITTHSPLVLSQLNEGEAYLLKRDKDNVVRSHLINSPNTRLLENVLQDVFGVNLNELKRQNMANIDQSKAKKKLLELLNSQVSQ